ncbi:MAG TPA: DUF4230 domain-containing protein, partial [Terrimicrobiaceae bacterium]|nr:DUF4230 domain-containing protein [Terrimicrobiaceae bacterium]
EQALRSRLPPRPPRMPDSDPLKPQDSRQAGCLGVLGWVVVAALLTIALTLLVFWRMSTEVTQDARRLAESVAADFNRAFQFTPRVSVDSVVVVAESTPVLELVVAQRQILIRHRWTHTWLHSTKNLELEATFAAKAGFDLTEPFRINIDPRSGSISAELPPPKLLSLGMSDVRVLRDEDGLWNKLTAEDRQEAFRALEDKARQRFAESRFLAEAGMEAEKQVRALLDKTRSTSQITPPSPEPRP